MPDTRIDDIRIPGAVVHRLLGASRWTIRRRRESGDWPALGQGRKYALSDILTAVLKLWCEVSAARKELATLRAAVKPVRLDKAEAERLLKVEQVRKARRLNDLDEARVVEVEEVRQQIGTCVDAIKRESANLTEELTLRLALDGKAVAMLETSRRDFLRRVATAMGVDGEGAKPC